MVIESMQDKVIIAGPCSVETPEQLRATVVPLVAGGIKEIRVGIWKPRTRPGSFEGLGKQALPWVEALGNELEVDFTTEVARPLHVEEALRHNITRFWIGARSTTNPFTVQELAEAMRGLKVSVMIKNPVNPDPALWIGAVERMQAMGIEDIRLIHRGFSNYSDTFYRNSPMWQLPISLKTHFPDLPMLCDPSHICGRRDTLAQVAQMAMDLNFDGLMVETHHQPDAAWSDAVQQLTPEAFFALLKGLRTVREAVESWEAKKILQGLRDAIDACDRELMEALLRRQNLAKEVGLLKKKHGVALFQRERWKQVFASRAEWAEAAGLDAAFVQHMYELIHVHALKTQEAALQSGGPPSSPPGSPKNGVKAQLNGKTKDGDQKDSNPDSSPAEGENPAEE
ncbi:chorismate mutase [Nitritalea halalkaliphila LW7]|uniref:chorismate mutase n=1 Tax=Nitritalea halalkaliphila LW7 TaxID=1189621 RepID=I5C3G8_9BACT|nr:bifunctional 3-deoxy-7-phosphoheptulonate synthase/chorismate mutase type II [Nitritalea halalkaliphila]EIM76370.1 chorismate mutase [Nitritalea halalkaliphila LW7]